MSINFSNKTIKISDDIDSVITEKSKKTHVSKQYIVDSILREEFKDDIAEIEEKEEK